MILPNTPLDVPGPFNLALLLIFLTFNFRHVLEINLMLHYNIIVKGRVQGVWYRKYTKDAANSYDLKGFVQNLEDGDVYIEAEGTEENLRHFMKWLEKGSPMSEVTEVNISEGDFVGFTDFEITR